MKALVTEKGVTIPKRLLQNAKEVEILNEDKRIVIIPRVSDDPIFRFGCRPVRCGIKDASESHDQYLSVPIETS